MAYDFLNLCLAILTSLTVPGLITMMFDFLRSPIKGGGSGKSHVTNIKVVQIRWTSVYRHSSQQINIKKSSPGEMYFQFQWWTTFVAFEFFWQIRVATLWLLHVHVSLIVPILAVHMYKCQHIAVLKSRTSQSNISSKLNIQASEKNWEPAKGWFVNFRARTNAMFP